MPLYEYKAYDKNGKALHGLIDSASKALVYEKLKAKKIFPYRIAEERSQVSPFAFNLKEQLAFSLTQLAALIRAGLPLVGALDTLSSQIENDKLKRSYIRIKTHVQEGENFAAALSRDPVFPSILVYMVEAGESVGILDNILDEYAKRLEKEIEFQKKIVAALVYPSVIVLACVGLVLFILTYVAPTIIDIFEGFKQNLPLSTTVLLFIGTVLKKYFYIWILLIAGIIFTYIKLIPLKTKEHIKLQIPFIGFILRYGMFSRWASTLAMLHRGGVSLVKALDASSEVVNLSTFRNKFADLSVRIEKGDSLSKAMKQQEIFPTLLIQMVETGEKTAQLDKMLDTTANFYEKEIDRKLSMFISILEPALILILGAVVAFVVVSILLPIFEINKMIR
ncbi:MAG: type II secretion system F family protein [Armatimonadota bacterium]